MQKRGLQFVITAFFMLLLFRRKYIMKQNNKLSGQPVICQLFSFLRNEIIEQAVEKYDSDRYYKTLFTKKQLIFLLYGVVTRCNSLKSLCKNLLFLNNKLMYLDVDILPAVNNLSDANINLCSDVFGRIYYLFYEYYKKDLSDSYFCFFTQN